MNNICEQLHTIVCEGKRFDFSMGYETIPFNGIYIMLEKGEVAHNKDRIVRIGTHTGDKQLKSRIFQHFENENKNRSIFRKNIGRCILNRDGNPYLQTWNLDTTTKAKKEQYAELINHEFEMQIERCISEYIQSHFSFFILEIPTKEERLYLEARLIGTVSGCKECGASSSWFGMFSPIKKIRQSGLWQVMELYSTPLSEMELETVSSTLVRNK